jgi:hypothetical protein
MNYLFPVLTTLINKISDRLNDFGNYVERLNDSTGMMGKSRRVAPTIAIVVRYSSQDIV